MPRSSMIMRQLLANAQVFIGHPFYYCDSGETSLRANAQRPEINMKSPAVTTLFREYLQRRADAHSAGFAAKDLEGDVVPHEAAATPPADPQLAWEEACLAI